MTIAAVREYINKRKVSAESWRKLGAALGVNYKQLQMIAAGKRDPDKNTLKALGIEKTARISYKFVRQPLPTRKL